MIREQDVYAAVRVAMPASVATAALALKVDANVGDPVTPGPVEVSYPALLDEPFTMVGYPLATVLAEKLVTVYSRGRRRTRAPVVVSATIAPAASWPSSCSMHGTRSPTRSVGR